MGWAARRGLVSVRIVNIAKCPLEPSSEVCGLVNTYVCGPSTTVLATLCEAGEQSIELPGLSATMIASRSEQA